MLPLDAMQHKPKPLAVKRELFKNVLLNPEPIHSLTVKGIV